MPRSRPGRSRDGRGGTPRIRLFRTSRAGSSSCARSRRRSSVRSSCGRCRWATSASARWITLPDISRTTAPNTSSRTPTCSPHPASRPSCSAPGSTMRRGTWTRGTTASPTRRRSARSDATAATPRSRRSPTTTAATCGLRWAPITDRVGSRCSRASSLVRRLSGELGDGLEQHRRRMQVGRGSPLLVDVVADPVDLLGGHPQVGRDDVVRDAVVLRPEHQIQPRVVQRVVEVLLRLREAEGVRRRLAPEDLLVDAKMASQRVDLALVQTGDGLHIGGAVAELHEESLVVLETIGRARDGIAQAVGVVVLQHLSDALLEIGRGHDLEIRARRQTEAAFVAGPGADDELEEVQELALERVARENDLPRQIGLEVNEDTAHRGVPDLITAGRLEHRRDVVDLVRDLEPLAESAPVDEALRARVALGEEQREDALRSESPDAERRDAGGVDPARHRNDHATAPQALEHRDAKRGRELRGLRFEVERERIAQHVAHVRSPACRPRSSVATRARSSFPDSLCGSASTNAIAFGTLKGARCSRQKRRRPASVRLLPARRTTNAAATSPLTSSVEPTTAASATSGWRAIASSISLGLTRWPSIFRMSFVRPT